MRSAMWLRKRITAALSVLRASWQEYERDHARYLATAMVYYALISLVPLLLSLALLGLLLRVSDAARDAERQLRAFIDASVGTNVGMAIEQLFQQLQEESIVTDSSASSC